MMIKLSYFYLWVLCSRETSEPSSSVLRPRPLVCRAQLIYITNKKLKGAKCNGERVEGTRKVAVSAGSSIEPGSVETIRHWYQCKLGFNLISRKVTHPRWWIVIPRCITQIGMQPRVRARGDLGDKRSATATPEDPFWINLLWFVQYRAFRRRRCTDIWLVRRTTMRNALHSSRGVTTLFWPRHGIAAPKYGPPCVVMSH